MRIQSEKAKEIDVYINAHSEAEVGDLSHFDSQRYNRRDHRPEAK